MNMTCLQTYPNISHPPHLYIGYFSGLVNGSIILRDRLVHLYAIVYHYQRRPRRRNPRLRDTTAPNHQTQTYLPDRQPTQQALGRYSPGRLHYSVGTTVPLRREADDLANLDGLPSEEDPLPQPVSVGSSHSRVSSARTPQVASPPEAYGTGDYADAYVGDEDSLLEDVQEEATETGRFRLHEDDVPAGQQQVLMGFAPQRQVWPGHTGSGSVYALPDDEVPRPGRLARPTRSEHVSI
ncbi:unnamed protein product [Protopolystoma xenopodis]|uniref:Uncharacterized protein n=1 Tax=Protopolystoma xenopodis TaxID=117903 RepID=A0A448X9B6_9PLAT|nr:unnamed protein product [Protopolystoma xenopodis]